MHLCWMKYEFLLLNTNWPLNVLAALRRVPEVQVNCTLQMMWMCVWDMSLYLEMGVCFTWGWGRWGLAAGTGWVWGIAHSCGTGWASPQRQTDTPPLAPHRAGSLTGLKERIKVKTQDIMTNHRCTHTQLCVMYHYYISLR